MPIYEFRCDDCSHLSSIFTRTINAPIEERCKHCGSERVHRAPAKVAYHRGEQSIREQFGSPAEGSGLDAYSDPRQIGRWVEKRFDDMGLELPKEARTMIDAARQGEFPEPVNDL